MVLKHEFSSELEGLEKWLTSYCHIMFTTLQLQMIFEVRIYNESGSYPLLAIVLHIKENFY